MGKSKRHIVLSMIALMVFAGFTGFIGCQFSGGDGIHVMFKGVPKIHHNEVYHRGRVVGSILEQVTGNNGASKVTIRIDPDYREQAGNHWAFYVDMGRLTAGRLNRSGKPLQPGDLICGFQSKAAFNWFKVKTLLSDRISEAERRAEKLHLRFAQTG